VDVEQECCAIPGLAYGLFVTGGGFANLFVTSATLDRLDSDAEA
jgi:hypothetical protein